MVPWCKNCSVRWLGRELCICASRFHCSNRISDFMKSGPSWTYWLHDQDLRASGLRWGHWRLGMGLKLLKDHEETEEHGYNADTVTVNTGYDWLLFVTTNFMVIHWISIAVTWTIDPRNVCKASAKWIVTVSQQHAKLARPHGSLLIAQLVQCKTCWLQKRV